jgi:hypothetical protein
MTSSLCDYQIGYVPALSKAFILSLLLTGGTTACIGRYWFLKPHGCLRDNGGQRQDQAAMRNRGASCKEDGIRR